MEKEKGEQIGRVERGKTGYNKVVEGGTRKNKVEQS